MYDFGIIGNCQVTAQISRKGAISWLCMPRPDSAPIFGSILDPLGGGLDTELVGETAKMDQSYIKNTNILVTSITNTANDQIEITDFCPRFEQHGRMFRPASLFRIITPINGDARVRVNCRPVLGWEKTPVNPIRANSHVRYEYPQGTLRIVTNMPLTYFLDGESFLVQEQIFILIFWEAAFEADIKQVALDFLNRTQIYWEKWVKHCSIPSMFQEEVIRSALTLKQTSGP